MSTTTGDPIDGAIERLLDQGDKKVPDAVGVMRADLDQRQLREALEILSRICPPDMKGGRRE